jgi:predicted GNAT family N-acyltransferase
MSIAAGSGMRVEVVDYADAVDQLRAVREPVFVQEQQVPLALEWDALDPLCVHVLARDEAGRPIGTGRLVPPQAPVHDPDRQNHDRPDAARIGRMAVLPEWRGHGIGQALLDALLDQARQRRWWTIGLHAQVSAIGFYVRNGFVPEGPRFMEAGIEHQTMRRQLGGPTAIETREAAVAIASAVVAASRRELWIYSRSLDPGLLDTAEVVDALRDLATRRQRVEIRILLQDAGAPQRTRAPLIGLAQRLSSSFGFREVSDPADRGYPSAYVVNDSGGYYFRPLGHRFDGEAEIDGGGRARQLADAFQPIWERSRPCNEYRALEI